MPYENITYEKRDQIGYVTINRPKVLNALNRKTVEELADCLASARDDAEVRVLIITGAGEKSFVAGADINELAERTAVDGKDFSLLGQSVFRMLETLGKPSIAAINGYALGGGCELAMSCHFRYAADTAKMGQPEINLGIIPGWGGTQRLARFVGRGRAIELMLTGDVITAQEAERIGLVNRVVPAAELKATVLKLAQRLANSAPLAMRAILDAVDRGLDSELDRGMEIEFEQFPLIVKTEDAREGITAFLNKQKPVFKGK